MGGGQSREEPSPRGSNNVQQRRQQQQQQQQQQLEYSSINRNTLSSGNGETQQRSQQQQLMYSSTNRRSTRSSGVVQPEQSPSRQPQYQPQIIQNHQHSGLRSISVPTEGQIHHPLASYPYPPASAPSFNHQESVPATSRTNPPPSAPAFDEDDLENVPRRLICPITEELMKDPVMLVQTGQVYERSSIEKWLITGRTDPLTNVVLRDKTLVSVNMLRLECKEMREKGKLSIAQKKINNLSPLQQKAVDLEQVTEKFQKKQKEVDEMKVILKQKENVLLKLGDAYKEQQQKYFTLNIQLNTASQNLKFTCVKKVTTATSDTIKELLSKHTDATNKVLLINQNILCTSENIYNAKKTQESLKQKFQANEQELSKLKSDIDRLQQEVEKISGVSLPKKMKEKPKSNDKNMVEKSKPQDKNKKPSFPKPAVQQLLPNNAVREHGGQIQPSKNSFKQRTQNYPSSSSSTIIQQPGFQSRHRSEEQQNKKRSSSSSSSSLNNLGGWIIGGVVQNQSVVFSPSTDPNFAIAGISAEILVEKPLIISGLQLETGQPGIHFIHIKGLSDITIKKCNFQGIGLRITSRNIDAKVRVEEVRVNNAPSHGLQINGCNKLVVHKSTFSQCGGSGVQFFGCSGKIFESSINQCKRFGVWQDSSSSIDIQGSNFEENQKGDTFRSN